MNERDGLANLLAEQAVYTADSGCEFYIGTQELADAILNSDWLKARDAARWDEGQLASVQLHQLLLNQSFLATKANPYRDYPDAGQRTSGLGFGGLICADPACDGACGDQHVTPVSIEDFITGRAVE